MHARMRLVALGLLSVALATISAPAWAATVVEDVSNDVAAGCTGTRHTPAAGFPDSFSALLVALLLATGDEPVTLTSVDGSGSGASVTVVPDDGALDTELPLVSYGPGTLTAEQEGEQLDLGSLATFEITDDEPPCSAGDLPAAAPLEEPSEEPSEEPREAPSEEPNEEPTQAASEPPPDAETDVPATDPAAVDVATGPTVLPILLILLGAVGLIVGGTRTIRRRQDGGTGTSNEGDDPGDVRPPPIYGEEIGDQSPYDYEVWLVTGGNFQRLDDAANPKRRIREADPEKTVVMHYYVAVTTEVAKHEESGRDADTVQIRGLQGLKGEAEALYEGDAERDLYLDYWTKLRVRTHGMVHQSEERLSSTAALDMDMVGWRMWNKWTSGESDSDKFADVPVATGGGRAGDFEDMFVIDADAEHQQTVNVSIQSKAVGPAAGTERISIFSGEGDSHVILQVEHECAWCDDSTDLPGVSGKNICPAAMTTNASAGYTVKAQSDGADTTFRYTNNTTASATAGGTGTAAEQEVSVKPLILAGRKIKIKGVEVVEVGLTTTPAKDHNLESQPTFPHTGDDFKHANGDRLTITAVSSVLTTASLGTLVDGSTRGPMWRTGARARAATDHDLDLHAQVDSVFHDTWNVDPRLTVSLDDTGPDGQHDGYVEVDGVRTLLTGPHSQQRGEKWWDEVEALADDTHAPTPPGASDPI